MYLVPGVSDPGVFAPGGGSAPRGVSDLWGCPLWGECLTGGVSDLGGSA